MELIELEMHELYAAVSSRTDVDVEGCLVPTVTFTPDRTGDENCDAITAVVMTPKQARLLATSLRKHANFIDPPKPRRKKGDTQQ